MGAQHDSLEILARAANDLEAQVIVNALERVGIRAVATGGYTSGMQAEAPTDVQIRVLKSMLVEARRALAELRAASADESLTES